MKRQIIFCLLFFATFSLFAQSNRQAERIIADFINSVEQHAVRAEFEMIFLDINNRATQTQHGIFRMRQDKFSFITDDFHVFFDGKTQWTYFDAVGEVSITEPSIDELAEINPILVLRAFQNKSTIRFSIGDSSSENHSIEIIPNVPADFNRITVQINRATGNLRSIHLIGNQGFSIQVSFRTFQRGLNIPDSYFVFDINNYDDDVFINDLR